MKTENFRWVWTALVTPFKTWNGIDNKVDYKALDKLIDMQLKWWVDWILLLWTTAESPTITKKEGKKIVEFAIKKIAKKTKVMVNIWTYSTKESLKKLELFEEISWIDAYLVVNPYYNKPTQTGLFSHFTTIAKATKRPVVLYNIKWRTWVNLETSTLLKIASECKNVIWVKEASWDLAQIKEVIEKRPENFLVFSWEESLTYDLTKNWWDWVISVASNCIPALMKEFLDECLEKSQKASELQEKYLEFFNALFLQTNPLPAKTFLASKWIIKETFRLPLCPIDKEKREEFLNIVKKYNF